jgi:NAD(P)-dependent dehydrogenase (short-subunit alcohol dehydrogenase family)
MNTTDLFSLQGRSALVTGGSRGIGRMIAEGFLAQGARVYISARKAEACDRAAAEMSALGPCVSLPADVSTPEGIRDLVAAYARHEATLDILVNNAGSNIPEPFVEVSEEHLDRLLSLNVRAAFLVAQAAAKRMLEAPERRQRGGAILHMSSQMGHVGAVNRTVYCMSKHALEGLTKAMALELAPHGIRVVSIAPTFVETPLYNQLAAAKPGFAQWVKERIPAGGVGRPEDVASAVVFAASPAAALVTGTSLLVDGGWTAQ